jgi:L-2-hydroxyglutarate oxidase
VLALAREGRRPWSISPRDVASWLTYPGFWRLATRHASSGAGEVWREASERAFLREYRRYVPGLRPEHLGPAFFGTRAQLLDRWGSMLDDFLIAEAPGRVVVLNAPSPAATACLAIGEAIAARVRAQLAEIAR